MRSLCAILAFTLGCGEESVELPPGPAAVVTGQWFPEAVALDRDRVYFTEYLAGTVRAASREGGELVTLAEGIARPWDLALDEDFVYCASAGSYAAGSAGEYLRDGSVLRIPKAGGEPLVLAAEQDYPLRVAVDDTFVYWLNHTSPRTADDVGSVARVPKAGGTIEVLAPAELEPNALLVAGGWVTWSNLGMLDAQSEYTAAAIRRIPVAGGSIETVIEPIERPLSLATDGTTLYTIVTRRDNLGLEYVGEVVRVEGSGTMPLSGTVREPRDIAAAEASLFWLHGNDTIEGVPTPIWSSPDCYQGRITVDATAIFWTCRGDGATPTGEVRRILRSP